MTTRSAEVLLKMKTDQYKAEAKAAQASTEALDRSVEATDRDLKKIPADAAKAAAAMKLLGVEAGATRVKLEDVGGSGPTRSLQVVDSQITAVTARMKQLAEEFNRTGSAQSYSLLQGLTKDRGELVTMRKDISNALGIAAKDAEKAISNALEAGGQAGSKSLLSSLQGVLSTPVLGPITVGAIAGAVVAAAPAIGAAIGAAVIGGTGLSLIGLGIAGQIHSPAVEAAFGQLKQHATDDLTGASSVFGSTLVKGLHGFTDELDKIAPDVQRNLSKLSVPAGHLFDGIGQFLDKLGPGIDALSSASAPFIDVLAAELPRLASAFSQMFSDISANAPGAITFFHDLFTVIDILIIATGKFASAMEKLYGWLREVADIFGGHPGRTALGLETLKGAQDAASASAKELKTNMEVAGASIDIAGSKAMSASDQYGMLISQLNAVNNTADKVAGAMVDKLVGSMLNSDRAANEFDKSLVTLGDTLVSNGGQLSAHVAQLKKSETGQQQNKDAILAVVEANLRVYDSQIAVGISAQDAAAKYDQNTKALEDQLRAAGYTTKQIDDLIGKYRGIPTKVDSDIAIHGLTDAINDMNDLYRLINGLPSRTITIQNVVYTNVPADQLGHGLAMGAIRTAAVGVIIPPRSPGTLVGEPQTGGEALIPLRGISQMRAASLGQVAMSGYGLDVVPRGYQPAGRGGSISVSVTVSGAPGGSDLDEAMSSWFMGAVRKGDIQITAKAN